MYETLRLQEQHALRALRLSLSAVRPVDELTVEACLKVDNSLAGELFSER